MTEPSTASDAGSSESNRAARHFLVAAAASITFCVVYALVDYARLPRIWHDQVARSFRWDTVPRGPEPAGYAGMWLWGLVAAAVAAGLVHAVLKLRGDKPIASSTLGLWLAWTLTAFVLGGAYFTWNLWP